MRRPRVGGGDLWGGVSAMLVALPSAIAFGVTIFAPLGGTFAAQGATAGIVGTMALGLVAPALGGTDRLITAPCAPAAAVLSALALQLSAGGTPPETAVLLLGLVALASGVLQLAFGATGLGDLIKYMPYPVVSGYLSGVGLLILVQQVPLLFGAPKGAHLLETLGSPGSWHWPAMVVGAVTIGTVLIAPRVTKAVPSTILGLLAGVATYLLAGLLDPTLLSPDNAALVGELDGGSGSTAGAGIAGWLAAAGHLDWGQAVALAPTALSLAALLSIDTLKTCLVVDARTHSRHDSNRELRAQGVANVVASALGGIPGSGTMGATMVGIASGAETRASGIVEGLAALAAFLVLGSALAWIPIAALAGILVVVGARMFDRASLRLLRSRATLLDFAVIVAVVATAETVGLIAASAVGVGLAIVLFIREQARGSVVRGQRTGSQAHSKQVRLPSELAVLDREAERTAVIELQGSLFFGTTDALYTALAPHLTTRRFLILDMRSVRSVDVTAAHMLEQVAHTMTERGGRLLMADLPLSVAEGVDAARDLGDLGLYGQPGARAFDELDDALQWVEETVLAEAHVEPVSRPALGLAEIELFRGRKPDTLAALAAAMQERSYRAGDRIFAAGDRGDELFLIRRGAVRIVLPSQGGRDHHLATFRRGDFFGEMTFLDGQPRSADAVAERDTDLFVLPRARFEEVAAEHRRLGVTLVEGIATALALRLRRTDQELQAFRTR